jgi:TrmH family RNA methyltransferase
MAEFIVILQEPKHPGNVGAVARCMKNFGFVKLYLVNSCELGDECFKRSKHAKDIILGAKKFKSLSEVLPEIDYLVGTTGVVNLNDKHQMRNPKTPREFSELAKQLDESVDSVGLLFGREDYGLYQDELLHCDLLVTIPTDQKYPIMNLSHAVAVLLYEMNSAELKFNIKGHRKASKFERDKLYDKFREFLDMVDYPNHKRENTEVLFRRVLGRAALSKWEFHTLMGVFSRGSLRLAKQKKDKKTKTAKKGKR